MINPRNSGILEGQNAYGGADLPWRGDDFEPDQISDTSFGSIRKSLSASKGFINIFKMPQAKFALSAPVKAFEWLNIYDNTTATRNGLKRPGDNLGTRLRKVSKCHLVPRLIFYFLSIKVRQGISKCTSLPLKSWPHDRFKSVSSFRNSPSVLEHSFGEFDKSSSVLSVHDSSMRKNDPRGSNEKFADISMIGPIDTIRFAISSDRNQLLFQKENDGTSKSAIRASAQQNAGRYPKYMRFEHSGSSLSYKD